MFSNPNYHIYDDDNVEYKYSLTIFCVDTIYATIQ